MVMDEPTTALSDRETDRLFEVVRQLRSEGMAIIYISLEWPKSTAWRPSFGLQGWRICR